MSLFVPQWALASALASAGFAPPSTPLRVSRQATAPEQGCGCACLPVPPLCPSVGSVLILASSALLSAPLRASRSATAPEQGRGHECLAGVSVYPPRGVIFGEALYPIPGAPTPAPGRLPCGENGEVCVRRGGLVESRLPVSSSSGFGFLGHGFLGHEVSGSGLSCAARPMVRPRKMPIKNEDGAPCKVCGATENTLWYCACDAEQNRHWLCAGNRWQRGAMVRCEDREHKLRRTAGSRLNIEDAGWTPWKPAPARTPQKRAPAKKKAAQPDAEAWKRKTHVPPRSAEPKKPKQPKKRTLWDDMAEDEDEDGEDEEEEASLLMDADHAGSFAQQTSKKPEGLDPNHQLICRLSEFLISSVFQYVSSDVCVLRDPITLTQKP